MTTTCQIKLQFKQALNNFKKLKNSRYGKYLELLNVHFVCDTDYICEDLNDNEFLDSWYQEHYEPILKDQLPYCINLLKRDKETRQAILVMADRECYLKNDFICTAFMQVFLNDNHIKYIVNMRSSDIAKFHNDLLWHKKIAKKIKQELDMFYQIDFVIDHIEWNAMSLHIYEKDFDKLYNI